MKNTKVISLMIIFSTILVLSSGCKNAPYVKNETSPDSQTAVEIQDHPGAALVLGHDPRPLKMLKIVVPHQHLPPVQGGHQLAQLVLALPGGLQRQARHKGLEKRQLRANQLCVQLHAMSFLS